MTSPAGPKQLVAITVALGMFALAGCVIKGKGPTVAAAPPSPPRPVTAPSSAPPTPPPPLSTPQTRVELPAPQPLSQEAIASTEVPGEPPAPPAPAPKKGPRTPTKSRPTEVTPPAAATPPPAVAPPVAAPPSGEPARAPIQEIIPAEDLNRLRTNANARKEEIRQRLARLPRRGLTKQQKDVVDTIQSFVRLSDEAERSGDVRRANELAERGAVLAQGLPVR